MLEYLFLHEVLFFETDLSITINLIRLLIRSITINLTLFNQLIDFFLINKNITPNLKGQGRNTISWCKTRHGGKHTRILPTFYNEKSN